MDLLFPDLDVPSGWTAKNVGPRRWLLPPGPAPDARIVLAPLLPRRAGLPVQTFLEETLRAELIGHPSMRMTAFEPIRSAAGLEGLSFELAILAAPGPEPKPEDVSEWRAYAGFADERLFYSMFLQAHADAYPRLRAVFLAAARTLRPARTGR